jgi:hypothetical protein
MTRLNQRMAESALGVIAVYTFVGWVYVALCALVAPETLQLPLTHLFAWPREDTFGVMCFAISFVSALGWRLLRARRIYFSSGQRERIGCVTECGCSGTLPSPASARAPSHDSTETAPRRRPTTA